MEFDYIKQGDCLELMKDIPDNSIDIVLCDLPYGMTDCSWDIVIPMDVLWNEYRRILKPNANVLLFGNDPFTSYLIQSNLSEYSHKQYWIKNNVTGGLLAKNSQ